MKTIIGPAAQGDLYFDRPVLDKNFWRKLNESHNVTIAAPRRVGKSSFMLNLVNKSKEGYECIYIITESINEPNEFFKKIYQVLITQLTTSGKIGLFFEGIVKRLDIRKISATAIEFGKPDINYIDEILLLCREIDKFPKKILLLIDEYSQIIENIITDKSKEVAKNFLHQCRELRQNPMVNTKISFVYTGSIGLENLVLSIDEPRSISDLGHFIIPPFKEEEAQLLVTKIIDKENYIFKEKEKKYFLKKLKWLLPYFIQVVMSEIESICIEKSTENITISIIDQAFKNALNNRSYFEHWLSRLRLVFKGDDFSCAKTILNITAQKNEIDIYELQDILTKFNNKEDAVIINTLIHDGYLIKEQTSNKFRFNSPLLQEWWLSNIVI